MNNNLLEVVDDGKNVRLYPLSTPILMSKTPSTHNQTMYMHDFFLSTRSLKSILHAHLATTNNQSNNKPCRLES